MAHPSTHLELALRHSDSKPSNNLASQYQLQDIAVVPYRPTLLGIPSELRLHIYTRYFKEITIFDAPSVPSRVIGLPPQRWRPSKSRWTPFQRARAMRPITDLFLICKQVKTEAAILLYQKATLGFVGCDMLTAVAGRTKLFLNLRTILFGSAQNSSINPMGMVSSIILDLTHSSSQTGQWADHQLPHDLSLTIFRRLLHSTPKLRRLELCVDSSRYAIFASRYILSGEVLQHLCKFRHLTYFDIQAKQRRVFHGPWIDEDDDDETSDVKLAFKALNWVLNRHIRDEYMGIDTRDFDLNPRDDVLGALELQVKIVEEMLGFEELKADKGLARTIQRELHGLISS